MLWNVEEIDITNNNNHHHHQRTLTVDSKNNAPIQIDKEIEEEDKPEEEVVVIVDIAVNYRMTQPTAKTVQIMAVLSESCSRRTRKLMPWSF